MDRITDKVTIHSDYITAMRRHFRMYPEVGGEECETQKTIMAELTAMGLLKNAPWLRVLGQNEPFGW
jgi:amidohydrolase